ncbi:MAG TPA: YXWGXW repeat-containing protein [Bryobacteraceae bacterium]|nr:YXWGXW repeat-containing protein [Bryobacteraceae bacterium]
MKTIRSVILIAALLMPCFIFGAHVNLGITVGSLPPPPPAGVVATPVGPPPGPGYVWVPGYWDWLGGRWVWVEGRWVLPPRPHVVWVAPAIDIRLHRGHWR